MKQYIDKGIVKAEIERRKNQFVSQAESFHKIGMKDKENYFAALASNMNSLSCFLDILEMKEVEKFIWNNARTTIPEDSSNQIICIKEDGLAVSTIGKIVNGTVKWAYLDDLLNTNSFNVEVKEIDLEKEVENWVKTGPHTSYPWCTIPDAIRITAEHFFELGLKSTERRIV